MFVLCNNKKWNKMCMTKMQWGKMKLLCFLTPNNLQDFLFVIHKHFEAFICFCKKKKNCFSFQRMFVYLYKMFFILIKFIGIRNIVFTKKKHFFSLVIYWINGYNKPFLTTTVSSDLFNVRLIILTSFLLSNKLS